jgi:hypothetical protein
MNTKKLMDEILAILRNIQNDEKKLNLLHDFMMKEIYEESELEEIPEKYKKVVFEIAGELLIGFMCFFNPETLEIESVPQKMIVDPEEFEMITGEKYTDAEMKHLQWQECIEVEPMDSHESFKVMEHFIDEVDDNNLQNKLINALNRHKPFANFKYIVENSEYRQQWFDFRQEQWELYVWDTLKTGINM